MENIDLFNNYATRLLVAFYDEFPASLEINAEKYIGESIAEPLGIGPKPDKDGPELEYWLKHTAPSREYEKQRKVFLGTVRFLQNERLIRNLDPRRNTGQESMSDDILVERALNGEIKREFALTAHGLSQLSKKVSGGKVIEDTLIGKLKESLTNETVKAVPGTAISAVGPWLGSLLGS